MVRANRLRRALAGPASVGILYAPAPAAAENDPLREQMRPKYLILLDPEQVGTTFA
jgi:hypothetical protein